MSLSRVFRAVLFMHEGTSSQAGMESRCRHIMGDMERKAKTLWDALGLVGRLSEQNQSREGCVCFLSVGFSVGSPARWSAMQGGGDGKWITGKEKVRAASRVAGRINFCGERKFRTQTSVRKNSCLSIG